MLEGVGSSAGVPVRGSVRSTPHATDSGCLPRVLKSGVNVAMFFGEWEHFRCSAVIDTVVRFARSISASACPSVASPCAVGRKTNCQARAMPEAALVERLSFEFRL